MCGSGFINKHYYKTRPLNFVLEIIRSQFSEIWSLAKKVILDLVYKFEINLTIPDV